MNAKKYCIAIAMLVGMMSLSLAAGAASWYEDWETGYTVDADLLHSPWVQAGGGNEVVARTFSGRAASGSWEVMQDDGWNGVASASRPTGANLTDTDVVAVGTFMMWGDSDSPVIALSPSATDGGNYWRSQPGSLVMMWTGWYGIEVYTSDALGASLGSIHAGDPARTYQRWVQVRISLASASGAQDAMVDYRIADGAYNTSWAWQSWQPAGSIQTDSSFQAVNFGFTSHYSAELDDMSFSSVPEPGSMAGLLAGLAGLSGLIIRRRR